MITPLHLSGTARPTNVISSTQATATINTGDLTTVMAFYIVLKNPNGMVSNPMPFKVIGGNGAIIVRKNAVGGNGIFGFTSNISGNSSFIIPTFGGTGFVNISSVPSGTYTIQEIISLGWILNSITCDNGTTNIATRSATLNVTAGQTVNCTFTNN